MPDTHHCCCPNPCKYEIRVRLFYCPWKPGSSAEFYTFTFDGPSGEHQETSGYLDGTSSLEAVYENPGEGSWTVEVSGPAGSYAATLTVEACKTITLHWYAMHATVQGCQVDSSLALIEDAAWSVSGPNVGAPSSGATGADGKYAYLIGTEDSWGYGVSESYTESVTPPIAQYASAGRTITVPAIRTGCPYGFGLGGITLPPADGYVCACASPGCEVPVKARMILTTKYGSYEIDTPSFATGTVQTTGWLAVSESESRDPISCPPGVVAPSYVLESGLGSASAAVKYDVWCVPDNAFRIRKYIKVLPSFTADGYGNYNHVGYRMSSDGGDPTTPSWYAVTSEYTCPTLGGTASLPDLTNFETWKYSWICTSSGSHAFTPPVTIPGSGDTYTISEAP